MSTHYQHHQDTGNEASITEFIKNTGIMLEIAPQFKAMVVFVEHRYYGDGWINGSWPFGTAAFEADNLRYLTVEQALADFVEVRMRCATPTAWFWEMCACQSSMLFG